MLKYAYGWKKGAGRTRPYYRIKEWLEEKNIRVPQLALDVGIHQNNAYQTLRGLSNNRKILRRLLELGCPPDILSLPEDMKAEADAKN